MPQEKKTQKLGTNFRPSDIAWWYAWCDEYQYAKADTNVSAWKVFTLLPGNLRNLAILDEWELVREWLDRANEMSQDGGRFAKSEAERAILNMDKRPALSASRPQASKPATPTKGRKRSGG